MARIFLPTCLIFSGSLAVADAGVCYMYNGTCGSGCTTGAGQTCHDCSESSICCVIPHQVAANCQIGAGASCGSGNCVAAAGQTCEDCSNKNICAVCDPGTADAEIQKVRNLFKSDARKVGVGDMPAPRVQDKVPVSDCSDSSLQVKINQGEWYEYCCTRRDGSQDVSYYAKFHSANNDHYTTQSVVADDSGNSGLCANSSAGPSAWKSYQIREYSDNFDHEERYYDVGSGGTYLKTQISFRVGCTTPGSGSMCQISIDHLNQCNGRSCGSSAAVSVSRNKAILGVHSPASKGRGSIMFLKAPENYSLGAPVVV